MTDRTGAAALMVCESLLLTLISKGILTVEEAHAALENVAEALHESGDTEAARLVGRIARSVSLATHGGGDRAAPVSDAPAGGLSRR